VGILDRLFQQAPGIVAKGIAGKRAGEDRQRAFEAQQAEQQRQIQREALQAALMQSRESREAAQHPLDLQRIQAQIAETQAQAAERTAAAARPAPTPRDYVGEALKEYQGKVDIDKRHRINDFKPVAPPVEKPGRALPTSVINTVAENNGQLASIDQALGIMSTMRGDKDGVKGTGAITGLGLSNIGPGDNIKNHLQSIFPKANISSDAEQNLRAAIGDIGSMVIRDRSGAAVTAAEFPRLRPFIPTINEPAQVIENKLKRMRAIIKEETELFQSNYGPDQGFQPIQGARSSVPPQTGKPAQNEDDAEAKAAAWLARRRGQQP
jgi:hypothetical protein